MMAGLVTRRPAQGSLALVLAGTAFLLSGLAALVYQVAWQRILALQTGVGVPSIAVIVASFMAGLGSGSWAGGVLSTRLAARRALLAFSGLELAIGLFGVASVPLYYDLLYVRAGSLLAEPVRAGAVQFLSLLPPTVLMGMSLPFLVRALLADPARAGRTVGFLYGINMLGAALGAALAPWVLVRHLGVRGAVLAAAALNLAAAVLALGLWRRPVPAEGEAMPAAVATVERRPFALWLALFALSGFCALSLEILWFRIVDVGVKSSAFTFGTVLAIYLLGSAAGALAGTAWADRLRRPLTVFLALQCGLLLYSGLGVLVLARLPPGLPGYEWFFGYWQGSEGFRLGMESDREALFRLYGLFPLLLYGPPTVLMGLSFPVLQHAVHEDAALASRRVGFLQAANIAGCVAGSLLVGLALLSWPGTPATMRLLLAVGVGFALVGLRFDRRSRLLRGLAIGLAALVPALPGGDAFWRRLHGQDAGKDVLLGEDATSVVALTRADRFFFVFVNGKSNSVLPYGAGEHTLLGAVPALVHPAPRDVAIIGLGSGNTAWAAGVRPETERIRVFEIAGPQEGLLRALGEGHDLRHLRGFLADPRVSIETADGRNAIERGERSYDLIEADALRPWTAGSGNLYSEEFFARCAGRLKPGGVTCTWAPTQRIVDTFARVFPHVVDAGAILVGSLDPLPFEPETWAQRAGSEGVIAYLGRPAAREVRARLRAARRVVASPRPAHGLNRDLFPRDEFLTP
jgi:predicted membrane-bound spermidine synthase